MITVTCQELGGSDCTIPITGNTLEEARRNLLDHAQKHHKEMLQKMTSQEQQGLMKKLTDLYYTKAGSAIAQ